MNIHHGPIAVPLGRPHPLRYAKRRLSSLIVSGAALAGIVSAAAAESAGLGHEVAFTVGLGTFLVLSLGLTAAESRGLHAPNRRQAASGPSSTQLGRDAEKVVGRVTGART